MPKEPDNGKKTVSWSLVCCHEKLASICNSVAAAKQQAYLETSREVLAYLGSAPSHSRKVLLAEEQQEKQHRQHERSQRAPTPGLAGLEALVFGS